MVGYKKKLQQGFTLVELLIVVIILALLAAIVVPQFGASTDDTKASSLDTTLVNMRSALDLYYQQHGHYPGGVTAVPAAGCATGTKGTGTAADDATRQTAFLDQMALYTDAAGGACSIKDATFKFGPYLKKRVIPTNPINSLATMTTVTTGDLLMAGDGAAAGAWKYDVVSGKFIANDTNADPSGNGWDTH